jgi:outer membrane usher protein
LPATLNGEDVGELNAMVEGQQLQAVDIGPILPRLQQLLSLARYEMLQTNATLTLSPAALEAAGIQTRFDFQNLRLLLTVPGAARRAQELNLTGSPNFTAASIVRPSPFSAYLNIRGGETYTEYSQPDLHGFSDPQVDFENVFNVRNVVLQNETVVNPSPGKAWEKRDSLLVWDQPEQRLRWELGDLEYPVTSLQGFLPMAGFSLHKEDSLQPYRLTTPLGQSAFFLKEDSKVEVLVNGQTVQTLQMSAGPHQISNFPLASGVNNVVLRITDAVGRVEYINATLFYDPGLLKGGEEEFNIAAGMPSTTDPNNPLYRYSNLPAGSAFYRYGFSDNFTAGLNAQATPDTQQGGGQAVWGTLLGTFSLDSGVSEDRDVGFGHAERLQYQYYIPRRGRIADGVVTLLGQHQSPDFTLPNPFITPAPQAETWNAMALYSQRLTENWNAGVSYSRQWAGGQMQQETYQLLTGYSWRGLRVNVTVERTLGISQPNGWGAFFVLTWTFSSSHSFFASYDTRSRLSRAEWQYTEPETIETIDATLGVQNSPGDTTGYGNVRYTGRRLELEVSQDALSDNNSMTSVHWGTALVYADGVFGVSQPVSDSFLLLDSVGSLRDDGGIGVERQGRRFLGQEDWLGPAVLPQVTGYYPEHLFVEPLQPGADFDPQSGDLRLEPTYHSGALVRIGQEATAYITATLVWADGKLAALQAGTLKSSDGTTTEFISNRDGTVYLHGLTAGAYTATLASHPETAFTVTIPATKEKNLNLGSIRVPITE